MTRTINLEPHAHDRDLVALAVRLERDHRRLWPAFGKPYQEPTIALDGREWTLDELTDYLGLDNEGRDQQAKTEQAEVRG